MKKQLLVVVMAFVLFVPQVAFSQNAETYYGPRAKKLISEAVDVAVNAEFILKYSFNEETVIDRCKELMKPETYKEPKSVFRISPLPAKDYVEKFRKLLNDSTMTVEALDFCRKRMLNNVASHVVGISEGPLMIAVASSLEIEKSFVDPSADGYFMDVYFYENEAPVAIYYQKGDDDTVVAKVWVLYGISQKHVSIIATQVQSFGFAMLQTK